MQLVFAGSEIDRGKFPRRDFAVHRHGKRSNDKWALMLSFHRKKTLNAQPASDLDGLRRGERPTRLRLGRAPPWRASNPPPPWTGSAVAGVQRPTVWIERSAFSVEEAHYSALPISRARLGTSRCSSRT